MWLSDEVETIVTKAEIGNYDFQKSFTAGASTNGKGLTMWYWELYDFG